MSHSNEIITSAKPHTIKKFELIEKYVDVWTRKILGSEKAKGVVYIDCMSNSGHYYDENNQIVEGTAIRVAKRLNDIIQNYPGKNAWLYFNDLSIDRIRYLSKELSKLELQNAKIEFCSGDCNDFLKKFDLRKHHYENTLLVYDPYEAYIDWDAINPFLQAWGEVIINHMVSDTARGAGAAKNSEVINKYQTTYQKSIEELRLCCKRDKLDEIIVKIIEEQTDNREYFVSSFPFFNRNNGIIYHLIHCTSHIEGKKLYKKIAWDTFGGKSSLKNTHGVQDQLRFDLEGEDQNITTATDDYCYYVQDIAKFIYNKYHHLGSVFLNKVYDELDRHPVFPSDGYKNEVKNELKETYGVTISGKPQKLYFKKE